jgi:DNA-binding CsgD family transcriptional regulator
MGHLSRIEWRFGQVRKEIVLGLVGLLLIVVLTLVDVFHDLNQGTSLQHVLVEVLVIVIALVGISIMAVNLAAEWRQKLSDSMLRAANFEQEAQQWKAEASSYIAGLATQIDRQFERWQLTPAEKEVALLLIKGLPTREIAEIRSVKEKTVRQQALLIYRKAGVHGRAELSAFFLEDLFLPSHQRQPAH